MRYRLPLILCTVAASLLPPARRAWADAMIVELSHAENNRAALNFASGCLLAALRERVRDADTHLRAGLWSIAIVTALYAVFRLACASRGLAVLLGAPDGMRDAIVQQGVTPVVIARYEAARPIVVGCFLALGMALLATAWFLSRRQFRLFVTAWSIALLIAAMAVALQLSIVWSADGVPSEFHALLVQALTVPVLLAWYHRHQRRFHRR